MAAMKPCMDRNNKKHQSEDRCFLLCAILEAVGF